VVCAITLFTRRNVLWGAELNRETPSSLLSVQLLEFIQVGNSQKKKKSIHRDKTLTVSKENI